MGSLSKEEQIKTLLICQLTKRNGGFSNIELDQLINSNSIKRTKKNNYLRTKKDKCIALTLYHVSDFINEVKKSRVYSLANSINSGDYKNFMEKSYNKLQDDEFNKYERIIDAEIDKTKEELIRINKEKKIIKNTLSDINKESTKNTEFVNKVNIVDTNKSSFNNTRNDYLDKVNDMNKLKALLHGKNKQLDSSIELIEKQKDIIKNMKTQLLDIRKNKNTSNNTNLSNSTNLAYVNEIKQLKLSSNQIQEKIKYIDNIKTELKTEVDSLVKSLKKNNSDDDFLKDTINNLNQKIDNLDNIKTILNSAIKNIDNELNNNSKNMTDTDILKTQIQENLNAKITDVNKVLKDKKVLVQEINNYQSKLNNLNKKLSNADNIKNDKVDYIERLQITNDKLRETRDKNIKNKKIIKNNEEKIKALNDKLNLQNKEITKLYKLINTNKENLISSEKLLKEKNDSIKSYKNELQMSSLNDEKFETKINELTEKNRLSKGEIDLLKEKLDDSIEELNNERKQNGLYSSEIEKLRQDTSKIKNEQVELRQKLESSINELSEYKNFGNIDEVKILVKERKSLEKDLNKLTKDLENVDNTFNNISKDLDNIIVSGNDVQEKYLTQELTKLDADAKNEFIVNKVKLLTNKLTTIKESLKEKEDEINKVVDAKDNFKKYIDDLLVSADIIVDGQDDDDKVKEKLKEYITNRKNIQTIIDDIENRKEQTNEKLKELLIKYSEISDILDNIDSLENESNVVSKLDALSSEMKQVSDLYMDETDFETKVQEVFSSNNTTKEDTQEDTKEDRKEEDVEVKEKQDLEQETIVKDNQEKEEVQDISSIDEVKQSQVNDEEKTKEIIKEDLDKLTKKIIRDNEKFNTECSSTPVENCSDSKCFVLDYDGLRKCVNKNNDTFKYITLLKIYKNQELSKTNNSVTDVNKKISEVQVKDINNSNEVQKANNELEKRISKNDENNDDSLDFDISNIDKLMGGSNTSSNIESELKELKPDEKTNLLTQKLITKQQEIAKKLAKLLAKKETINKELKEKADEEILNESKFKKEVEKLELENKSISEKLQKVSIEKKQLELRLENKQNKIDSINNEIKELDSSLNNSNKNNSKSNSNSSNNNNSNNNSGNNSNIKQRFDNLVSRVQKLEDDKKDLTQKLMDANNKINEYETDITKKQQQIELKQEDNITNKANIEEHKRILEEKNSNVDELQNKIKELEEKLSESNGDKVELQNLESKVSNSKDLLSSYNSTIKNLNAEISKLKNEGVGDNSEYERKINEMNQKVSEISNLHEQEKNKSFSLTEKIKDLMNKISMKNEQVDKLQKDSVELERKYNEQDKLERENLKRTYEEQVRQRDDRMRVLEESFKRKEEEFNLKSRERENAIRLEASNETEKIRQSMNENKEYNNQKMDEMKRTYEAKMENERRTMEEKERQLNMLKQQYEQNNQNQLNSLRQNYENQINSLKQELQRQAIVSRKEIDEMKRAEVMNNVRKEQAHAAALKDKEMRDTKERMAKELDDKKLRMENEMKEEKRNREIKDKEQQLAECDRKLRELQRSSIDGKGKENEIDKLKKEKEDLEKEKEDLNNEHSSKVSKLIKSYENKLTEFSDLENMIKQIKDEESNPICSTNIRRIKTPEDLIQDYKSCKGKLESVISNIQRRTINAKERLRDSNQNKRTKFDTSFFRDLRPEEMDKLYYSFMSHYQNKQKLDGTLKSSEPTVVIKNLIKEKENEKTKLENELKKIKEVIKNCSSNEENVEKLKKEKEDLKNELDILKEKRLEKETSRTKFSKTKSGDEKRENISNALEIIDTQIIEKEKRIRKIDIELSDCMVEYKIKTKEKKFKKERIQNLEKEIKDLKTLILPTKKGEGQQEGEGKGEGEEQQLGGAGNNTDISSDEILNGPNLLKKFEQEFDKYEDTYNDQLNDMEEKIIEHEKSEEILERIKQYAEASSEQINYLTNVNLMHQMADRNLVLYLLGRRVNTDGNKVRYNNDFNLLEQANKKNGIFSKLINGTKEYDAPKFSLKEVLGKKNNEYIAIYDDELGEDIPIELDEERNTEVLYNLEKKVNEILKEVKTKDIKSAIDLLVNKKLNGITEEQFGEISIKFKEIQEEKEKLQSQVNEWNRFKKELGDDYDDDQDINEIIQKYKDLKDIADTRNNELEKKISNMSKAFDSLNEKITHDTNTTQNKIKTMEDTIEFYSKIEKERKEKDKELEEIQRKQIELNEVERRELLEKFNSKIYELERYRDNIDKYNQLLNRSDEADEIEKQLNELKKIKLENESDDALIHLQQIEDRLDSKFIFSQQGGGDTRIKILEPPTLKIPDFLNTANMISNNYKKIKETKEHINKKITNIVDVFGDFDMIVNDISLIEDILPDLPKQTGGSKISLISNKQRIDIVKKKNYYIIRRFYDSLKKALEKIKGQGNDFNNIGDLQKYLFTEKKLQKLALADEFMKKLYNKLTGETHNGNLSDEEIGQLTQKIQEIDRIDGDLKNRLEGLIRVPSSVPSSVPSNSVDNLPPTFYVESLVNSGGSLNNLSTTELNTLNENLAAENEENSKKLQELKQKQQEHKNNENKTSGGASVISTFNPYNVKDFMEQFGDPQFKTYIVENLSLNRAKVEKEYADLQAQLNASNMSVV